MTHLLFIIYLAFISLGLPDSLLGSGWPVMHKALGVPLSYAGTLSMMTAACTIVSSLQTHRLTKKLGTGTVTAISVAMTAIALFGFSISRAYWQLCLWAVPFGLGAGSVDAALNNYVALNYKSRHMSWLHCMWGLGASVGPYAMGYALTSGQGWPAGYRIIGLMQAGLTVILLMTLSKWKKPAGAAGAMAGGKALSLKSMIRIRGVREMMLLFACYCALEQTMGLWIAGYLVFARGFLAETAAAAASLFFLGMTAGRAISGFITLKLSDTQLIRLGLILIFLGILLLLLPGFKGLSLAGIMIVGLGCAPIYPCIIHSTPRQFGDSFSQGVIGMEMASAYTGILILPPLFGLMADHIGPGLLPFFLLALLLIAGVMHEIMLNKTKRRLS